MPATWAWSWGARQRRPPCRPSSTSSAAAATRSSRRRPGRPDMPVVPLGPERCDALLRFFQALPEGDLTFIREEVHDPDTVRSWADAGGRWVSVDGDEVTG